MDNITTINLAACPLQYLSIGYVGETGARPVSFDFSAWATEYGSGVLQMLLQRPGDAEPYPVMLDIDGTTATWTPDATATEKTGQGQAQLIYTVGGVVVKNAIFRVLIAPSLGAAGDPPEPYEDWLERLTELAAETQQHALDAADSAEDAAAAKTAAETAQTGAEAAKTGAEAAEQTAQQAAALARAKAAEAAEAGQIAGENADYAQQQRIMAEADAVDAHDSAESAAQSAEDAQAASSAAQTAATAAAASASAAAGSAGDAASAVTEVETKGAEQITAINQAGTTQIAAVDAAGAAQVQAIEDKGEEVIASIPPDYTELADDVSDLKSSIEAHEQYAEETYAKQDGSYEDLTAGNAYELLSDRGDTNAQPYLFRQTGGDSSAYNREQLKKIVGGTVAWNQTMRDINDASQASNWIANNGTVAYSGGKIVFTPKANLSNKNFGQATPVSAMSVQGHKYFYSIIVNRSKAGARFAVAPRIGQTFTLDDFPAGVDYYIKGVFEASAVSALRFFLYPWGTASFDADGTETVTVKSPMIIDLTQMFGTAIADYIYSLEQATAGAGVAFFRSLFPADYYDYNPGELMSVEGVSAHETVGFNQWDEEWELGLITKETGRDQSSTINIRSKNYIPVVPSTNYFYYFEGRQNWVAVVVYYDENKNWIGFPGTQGYCGNTILKTPDNCHYVRFYCGQSYGTTYNHDICINLSDPTKNGTYKPYKKRTYPIDDSLTLRGIPKLDSNNKLYYDGDTYEPDGTVTRKFKQIVLDGVNQVFTASWGASDNGYAVYKSISDIYPNGRPLVLCEQFVNANLGQASMPPWTVGGNSGASTTVTFKFPSTITSTADANNWLKTNNVRMIYPVATPITETAEPYRELEICVRDGTEEFVSTSIVPVGHETFYPVNVFDYIDRLTEPDADMIADTVIAANKYFSVGNRLFLSTASIAAGAMIIPGTNCQETSLAAALNAINA